MINKITMAASSLLFAAILNSAQESTSTISLIPTPTSIGYGLITPSNSAIAVWKDRRSKTYHGCEVKQFDTLMVRSIAPVNAREIYTTAKNTWLEETTRNSQTILNVITPTSAGYTLAFPHHNTISIWFDKTSHQFNGIAVDSDNSTVILPVSFAKTLHRKLNSRWIQQKRTIKKNTEKIQHEMRKENQ